MRWLAGEVDVTEGEWLDAKDPQGMLSFLRGSGRACGRKLELFAAACLRRIAPFFTQQRSWEVLFWLELASEMTGVKQLHRKPRAVREQGALGLTRVSRVDGLGHGSSVG
jgi:hypothetical protein